MANRHVCATCLRALRQHSAELRPAINTPVRLLNTSRSQHKKVTTAPAAAKYQTPRPGPTSVTSSALGATPEGNSEGSSSIAHKLREKAPSFTETYVAYGACEALVKECARVADYSIPKDQRAQQLIPDAERGIDVGIGKGWWYETFGLTPNFNTWAQITFLHMWLLTVRLRRFPAAHAPAWHQHLTDHFFYLAEEKMVELHGLSVRSVRNRYLKDLFVQWRGLTAGYDQGMLEGDAVLATAVWRNVCGADERVDLARLAMVTAYVRSVLRGLEDIGDEDVAAGLVVFEDPAAEAALVGLKSRLWDQPFDVAERLAAAAQDTTKQVKA